MTLKRFCKLLNFPSFRRWKELIEYIKNNKGDNMSNLNEEVKKNYFTISREELAKAAAEKYPGFQFVALDSEYRTTTSELMEKIIQENKVDKLSYVKNFFDCENFSLALKSDIVRKYGISSVGVIVDIPGRHSYSMIACKENGKLKVYLLEPQNDKVVELGGQISNTEMYTGKSGYVLF